MLLGPKKFVFDESMFLDFCITLEENYAISREELIIFQHLVSQMLQCTLEETMPT